MSAPVWSIPAYHTDEDTWRERIEAKRAALNGAVKPLNPQPDGVIS